jgi:tetratricopeptide (TPR) repeat protein
MYGYAIINKVEKRLNEDINRYLEVYKNSAEDDEKKYEAAKELAFSYWEMVYTELSHESLRDNFLKEVVTYLSVAKDYYAQTTKTQEDVVETLEKEVESLSQKESLTSEELEKLRDLKEELEDKKAVLKHYKDSTAKLFVLMGRVYMVKKEYESAITEFTVAQELSASNSSFVLPYLAEIYFILGKFYIVKSILNKAESLELNARLYPIMQQWRS